MTEYDPFNERYHVLLNNGHVYHLASRHLRLTQAPAKAVQLPPMQKHPLPATVTPKYKPPPVCFDRPKPAGDQPKLGPHPPAPHPVRSTFEEPPPPPPGPVPSEPSVKQGPPPKTPSPRIPRGEPQVPVQRPIRKGLGFKKASVPRPSPARRTTLHYSLDAGPCPPWPHRETSRSRPVDASSARPRSRGTSTSKTASPPAIVKPCACQDYRKTTPAAEPKAAASSGHPQGAADRSGPRRSGPADGQPSTRRWVPNKGSSRPPRRRSRNPRLERRLPPQTRRQARRRRLPHPQQRRSTNLPTRAEHKPPSRETLRDFRGESVVIACTPIGSTLIPSGKLPPEDRHPSTPTKPSGAYWTCGTGTDTWERT